MAQSLGRHRGLRMVHILANGMLWSLYPEEILILPVPTFEGQPIESGVALVLVPFAVVPAENKMFGNVIDTGTNDAHGNVMPRHTSVLGFAQFVVCPVVDTLEVHDAVVVEVLTRENGVIDAGRRHIGKRVLLGVPPAKAYVKTTNESQVVVNHNEFFMMGL